MIEIIKELNIEVSKPNVFQAVVAKQYDMNTRFIKATFVDNGDKITIDPTATVKVVINALRPDGESKGFDGTVNEDGTVTVPLHSWMLELVGTVICDISVIDTETDDNKKLTTTSFTLLVEKAAFGGTDITNDPQYDVLVQLLDTCSTAGAMAEEALAKSNEANAKYDACVEATEDANVATQELENIKQELAAGSFITGVKDINKGITLRFWIGTQQEYADLAEKPKDCYIHFTDINVADYIVEEGTTEVEGYKWYYVKRNSGRCELYCYTKIKPVPESQKGAFYYSAPVTIPFPFEVGERVVDGCAGNVCFVCNVGSGEAWVSTDLRLASPLEFSEFEQTNGIPVNLTVHGTWKNEEE